MIIIMKIAVIGYPRTGSTKICYVLEQLFPTRHIGEILTHSDDITKSIATINTSTDILVKLFTYQLNDFDMSSINWSQFSLIVFTSRQSLVDSFISTVISNKRKQWIPGINRFLINDSFVVDSTEFAEYHRKHIAPYNKVVETISRDNNNTIHLTYDEINDTPSLLAKLCHPDASVSLFVSPTGIDYSKKCLNYAEIEHTVQDFLGKIEPKLS